MILYARISILMPTSPQQKLRHHMIKPVDDQMLLQFNLETSAMPVTSQLSATATPFAPSDTSVNDDQ